MLSTTDARPSEQDLYAYMHGSHQSLELRYTELIAAVEANDRPEILALWVALERTVLAHLEAEERFVLPAFARVDQAEAMALSDRIAIMNSGRLEQLGDPGTLYDRPSTAFVAQFLGKTNILRAPVLGAADGSAQVRLNGHPVAVPGVEAAGTEMAFSLRPEKLRFGGGDTGFQGRVATRVFQGDSWMFEIDTPLGRLFLRTPNTRDAVPCEGETVAVGFHAEDLRAIQEEMP